MKAMLNTRSPHLPSALRIVAAFLLVQHGGQKPLGFPVEQPYPFDPLSLSGVAGVLERVGGLLLLSGLFSHPAAFVMSGMMAFAYFIAHAPRDFWPLANGGELAIMYCFTFLYIAAAGGGPWSLDHILRNRRQAAQQRRRSVSAETPPGATWFRRYRNDPGSSPCPRQRRSRQ